MPDIYKIKKDNKLSVKNFTLKKAKEIQKAYKKRGIEVELQFYKTVKVIDMLGDGEVEFFSS